jgi:hypothetical protein
MPKSLGFSKWNDRCITSYVSRKLRPGVREAQRFLVREKDAFEMIHQDGVVNIYGARRRA